MNLSLRFLNAQHARHVLAKAIACSMLLVLPSCAIPPFRKAEPGPPLPATYQGTASPEDSGLLAIEDFFTDPLLLCLIHQALVGNRELRILDEDVQIAKNEILARSGAYLPFAAFRGTSSLEKFSDFTLPGAGIQDDPYRPGRFLPNPLPDFRLGLNLFWQLDIWRELRNARDAAAQRYIATAERRNYFVTRLVADVAENYYRLLALDNRLDTLDRTIQLFERSLKLAEARKEFGRGTALAVRRFEAEVRRNQSEKLIVRQDIIEVENRINFLANRFPQPVERSSADFFELNIHTLSLGVPAQLLLNRPDIRQAEHELKAAGLDVKVARAHFFPRLDLTGGIGYEAFNPAYLFTTPQALVGNIAADLTVPLANRRAIQAEYLTANARQLQSVYNYQRVILNAFTEVVTRVSMVQNYGRSIEVRKQQLQALQASVEVANKLFRAARAEYVDVLLSQRDFMDARMVLIQTKQQQLSAIVNTYQALGGGDKTNGLMAQCCLKPPVTDKDKAPAKDTDEKDKDKDKDSSGPKLEPDQELPAPRPLDKPLDIPPPRRLENPTDFPAPRPETLPPPPTGADPAGGLPLPQRTSLDTPTPPGAALTAPPDVRPVEQARPPATPTAPGVRLVNRAE